MLRSFATDAEGTPIPEDLVARMRAADEFGKGFLAPHPDVYAAISYWFHQERPDGPRPPGLRELHGGYSLIALLPDTHFHAASGTSTATPRRTTPTCGAW